MVRIVSDSTCDLTPELVAEYGITLIPLYVTLGEESYKDGTEITAKEVIEYAERTKKLPKTSAASVDDIVNIFAPIIEAGDDIVYMGISASMSVQYQNVRAAAELFPEGRVQVVDSWELSTGIALEVLKAADMAREGKSNVEIAEFISGSYRKRVDAGFILEDLTYLWRGGRCSAVQLFGANAMRLKIKIGVEEGAMKPTGKYRGNFGRCLQHYFDDKMADYEKREPDYIFVTHCQCDAAQVEEIRSKIEALNYFKNIYVTTAGCVITSHCGPGTLGILSVYKEN